MAAGDKKRKREEEKAALELRKRARAGVWTGFKQPLPDPSADPSLSKLFTVALKASVADSTAGVGAVMPAGQPPPAPSTLSELAEYFYSTHHYTTDLPRRTGFWSLQGPGPIPIKLQLFNEKAMHHPKAPQERYLRVTVWRKDGSVLDSGLDLTPTSTDLEVLAGVRGLLGLSKRPSAREREEGPLLLMEYTCTYKTVPDLRGWATEAGVAAAADEAAAARGRLGEAQQGGGRLKAAPAPENTNLMAYVLQTEAYRAMILELPRVPPRGSEDAGGKGTQAARDPQKPCIGAVSIPTYVGVRFVKKGPCSRWSGPEVHSLHVVLPLEAGEELGGPAAAGAIKKRLRAYLTPLADAKRSKGLESKELARLCSGELQYGPEHHMDNFQYYASERVDPLRFKNGAGRLNTFAEDGPRKTFDAAGQINRPVRPEDYPDPYPPSAEEIEAEARGSADAAYYRSQRLAREERERQYGVRRVARAAAVTRVHVNDIPAQDKEKTGVTRLNMVLEVDSADFSFLDSLHKALAQPLGPGSNKWSQSKFKKSVENIKECEAHHAEVAHRRARPFHAVQALLERVAAQDPRGAAPAVAAVAEGGGGPAEPAAAEEGAAVAAAVVGGAAAEEGAAAAAAVAAIPGGQKGKGKGQQDKNKKDDVLRVKMTLEESEESPERGTLTVDVFGRRGVGPGLPGCECEGLVMFEKSRFDAPPAKTFFDMYLEGLADSADVERARQLIKGPTLCPGSIPALLQSLEASEDRPQAEQPDGLTVTMRSYQRQSLQFMLDQEARDGGYRDVFWVQMEDRQVQGRRLWYSPIFGAVADSVPPQHRGGFLADEMGLGKTVVTLALALSDREAAPDPEEDGAAAATAAAGPGVARHGLGVPTTASVRSRATLVVCAVSLVGQWIDEARAKLGLEDFKIYQYHGSSRKRDLAFLADHDLVVTTYQTLSSDWSAAQKAKKESEKPKQHPLGAICWHRIILDEAHYVKSPATAQTKACVALESPRRWCVSGTPIGTDLGDLLGQFQFLRMAPVSHKAFFDVNFKEAFRGHGGMSRQFLSHVLRESMIRHSKKVLELPPKHTELVPVYLGTREQAKYLEVHKAAKEQFLKCRALGPMAINSNILPIMALTNPLRRICSGGNLTAQDLHVSDLMARLHRQAERAAVQKAGGNGGGGGGDGAAVIVPEDVADECSICLDEMERPLRTPCNHFYCGECIRGFLEQGANRGCPLCRAKVAVGQLCKAMTQKEADLEDARRKAEEERARRRAEGLEVEGEEEEAEEEEAVPEGTLAATSKLKVLLRELRGMRATVPQAKALVFSQYTSTVEALKKRLTAEGFGYRFITGSMPLNQRTKAIEAFLGDPPTTVFLLTMRTGAVGINLTAADHVFLLEPAMNPALEEQAIGRAWRMGQQRQVVVKRLYCKGTIEETILKLSDEKRSTADAAADGGDAWDRRRRRLQQRAQAQAVVVGNLRQDHCDLRGQEIELLFSDPKLEDEPAGEEEAAMERARAMAKTRGQGPDPNGAPREPLPGAGQAVAGPAAGPLGPVAVVEARRELRAWEGPERAAAAAAAAKPGKRKPKGVRIPSKGAARVEVEEAPEDGDGGGGGRRPRRAAAAQRPVYRVDEEEEEGEVIVVVEEEEAEEEEGTGKKAQARGIRGAGARGRGGRGTRRESDEDSEIQVVGEDESDGDSGSIEVIMA